MTAADAPTWTARVGNPYLHGIHGPVVHETTAIDLEVEGELPADLYGAYVRMVTVDFRALVKYDHEDGSAVRYDYPDGWHGSESPFAPRLGATGEDDGYVVTLMMNVAEARSECWVFAAQQIEKGPIAKAKLPTRVPSGFHARWVPGDRIF